MKNDRNIRRIAPIALAVAALFAGGPEAQAQSPSAGTGRIDGDSVKTGNPATNAGSGSGEGVLGAVVVTATRSPAAALGVPASVTVVAEDELRDRNIVRFGDALADVPGVYVRGAALGSGFPGSGQAVLSMRGIPRTPRTLVMIDGQPINNALTGGVNVSGIPFESIGRVEVVRGPYSALYGGTAMGGVINFISAGPDEPLTEVRLGAGNLQQRGASLVHRKRYEGGLGVTLSMGYRSSAGYDDSDYVIRSASAGSTGIPVTGAVPTTTADGLPRYWVGTKGARLWTQETAQLAFHYAPTAATKFVAGLGWSDYRVGYARPTSFLTDAAGNPVLNGSVTFNDGTARRLSVAEADFAAATPADEHDLRAFLRAEHRFDGGSVLRANLGTMRHDLRYSQATRGAATFLGGPGELASQPNERTDLDVSLRTPMSDRWALVGGFAYGHAQLDRKAIAVASWREWGGQGAVLNAGGGTTNNTALFLQSEHYFDGGLTAYVGGRYDRFDTTGWTKDSTATPNLDATFERRSFGEFSPKLALVWEARPWLSLHASYGEGFRPPALLDMYSRTVIAADKQVIIEPSAGLTPEKVRSFELGADALVAGGGRASATLYSQRVTDMIYRRTVSETVSQRITRFENVGAADIDGIEANVRWPVGPAGMKVFGAVTHQFRYEVSRNSADPSLVGKQLADVPRTTWSAGVEYAQGPWTGLVVARHVGHVFGTGDDVNKNTVEGVFGSFDAYTLLSAKVSYRVNRQVTLSLAGDNLTGRDYFVSTKQPGRTVYGEVAYRF